MANTLLGLLLTLNIGLTAFLVFKFLSFKKAFGLIKVAYFPEVTDASGFIKKSKRIQIKAQIMIGELPIGQSFLMSEQLTDNVDHDQIEKTIEKVIKPLSKLGLQAAIKHIANLKIA